jgi:hypothetical protein
MAHVGEHPIASCSVMPLTGVVAQSPEEIEPCRIGRAVPAVNGVQHPTVKCELRRMLAHLPCADVQTRDGRSVMLDILGRTAKRMTVRHCEALLRGSLGEDGLRVRRAPQSQNADGHGEKKSHGVIDAPYCFRRGFGRP